MPDEFDIEAFHACPICGGPGAYLGALGTLEHFRCTGCGMTFSRVTPAPYDVD